MAVDSYEESLLEFLISVLYARLGEPGSLRGEGQAARVEIRKTLGGGECAALVPMPFATPRGKTLTHTADILFTTGKGKLLAIDLKWSVNDLDPVKACAYDMQFLKASLGAKLRSMMIYIRPSGGGISGDQVRDICFPYDQFFAIEHQDPQNPAAWVPILDRIEAEITARP